MADFGSLVSQFTDNVVLVTGGVVVIVFVVSGLWHLAKNIIGRAQRA